MPNIIPPRRARNITGALFTALLLVFAVPAAANAACASSPTSTPFKALGDDAAYSLVQGGSFESGAPGWSLTNASVVSGSSVKGGSHSLAIATDRRGYLAGLLRQHREPVVPLLRAPDQRQLGRVDGDPAVDRMVWDDPRHDRGCASDGHLVDREPDPAAGEHSALVGSEEHAQRARSVQTRTVRWRLGDR